jgi:hypothetical protein
MAFLRLGRRTAIGAAAGFAATAIAGGARAEGPMLRDLYDAEGRASALARRLAGQRVAFAGYVAPAPSYAPGWFVLAEISVAPCALCGLQHDWPTGVLAVHGPAVPHIASMTQRVTIEGVLDPGPEGAATAGLEAGLALRDAVLVTA